MTLRLPRDEAGPEGGSLLLSDELHLELAPGPAASLVVDGAPLVRECSSRGMLGEVAVRAVDEFNNLAADAHFEVSMLFLERVWDGTA